MNLTQFLSSVSIEGAGEHTFDMIVEEGYTTIEQINEMSMQQIADIGKISKKTIGEKTAKRIWDSLHSNRVQELLPHVNLWVEEEPSMDEETTSSLINSSASFVSEDVEIGDTIHDLANKKDYRIVASNGGGNYSINELKDIAVSLKDQVLCKDSLNIQVEGGSELKIDLQGKKVLFTGKGEYSRDALTSILKRNGAVVKSSITKDLDLLILADLNSTSNKAKKARKWGIKMVTYKDVFGE
jgi:NAD-dependent DNA ligase